MDNNRPPEIVCAFQPGSDLGIKSSGFSFSYTVNDADNRTGEVTVTENLDGAKKKEFQPELGKENTFTSDGVEFQCLPNGKHAISLSASDGNPNQGCVYDIRGIAPTITDVSGGGGRQPMIVTENKI